MNYWLARTLMWQWQFSQSRRGLLPSFNEAAIGAAIRGHFTGFRSFEGWWEGLNKASHLPGFVEFVEEQRSKAA